MKLTDEALATLEAELERLLTSVREVRACRATAAPTRYIPLRPALLDRSPASWLSWLHPSMAAVLTAPPVSVSARLAGLLEEACDGVYAFPVLRPEVCDWMVEEGRHALAQPSVAAASSGFNRSHVVLDAVGMGAFQDWVMATLAAPLAAMCYPSIPRLDYRYGYLIGYSDAATVAAASSGGGDDGLLSRTGLRYHTDDSETTLNVQLADGFTGGDLVMRGMRGGTTTRGGVEGEVQARVSPAKGWGYLHRGQHLHEVTRVTSGKRYAWITWYRSTAYRATTCPCCMTLRPTAPGPCICDGTLP